MKPSRETISRLNKALNIMGENRVNKLLSDLIENALSEAGSLTIIVNQGVHHLPEEYKRGELFIASEGSLDFSSHASMLNEFTKILSRTATVLKSKPWRMVYIVPFGPSPLAMAIKLLVYRITGIESIDVAHLGNNVRVDLELSIRDIAINEAYGDFGT